MSFNTELTNLFPEFVVISFFVFVSVLTVLLIIHTKNNKKLKLENSFRKYLETSIELSFSHKDLDKLKNDYDYYNRTKRRINLD